jgi:uncharacterized membrane protein (DUF2068 family)
MTNISRRETDISEATLTEANAPMPAPPLPQRHPFGVRVIIALFIVKVIFMLGIVVALYFDLSMAFADGEIAQVFLQEMPGTLLSFVLLLPLNAVAAVGLWRRKRWAWVLTMVLLAYSMTLDIVNYAQGQPIYVAMLLNVIQVGYLNQQEVQALFQTPKQAVAP